MKEFDLPNGEHYVPRKFITCSTMRVVYLKTCKCGAFYVGKTKLMFRKWVHDNTSDIWVGRIKFPMPKHVGLMHQYDSSFVFFVGLEHFPCDPRGGDWNMNILQRETR